MDFRFFSARKGGEKWGTKHANLGGSPGVDKWILFPKIPLLGDRHYQLLFRTLYRIWWNSSTSKIHHSVNKNPYRIKFFSKTVNRRYLTTQFSKYTL
jgi:hypothetical protein